MIHRYQVPELCWNRLLVRIRPLSAAGWLRLQLGGAVLAQRVVREMPDRGVMPVSTGSTGEAG
eukprot:11249629-Heterocapsa_arctica.AAC.1